MSMRTGAQAPLSVLLPLVIAMVGIATAVLAHRSRSFRGMSSLSSLENSAHTHSTLQPLPAPEWNAAKPTQAAAMHSLTIEDLKAASQGKTALQER